jgi:hypothetical protein
MAMRYHRAPTLHLEARPNRSLTPTLPFVAAVTAKAGSANPKITLIEVPNLNGNSNWNAANWRVHAMV